jgi:hypothetical protein
MLRTLMPVLYCTWLRLGKVSSRMTDVDLDRGTLMIRYSSSISRANVAQARIRHAPVATKKARQQPATYLEATMRAILANLIGALMVGVTTCSCCSSATAAPA